MVAPIPTYATQPHTATHTHTHHTHTCIAASRMPRSVAAEPSSRSACPACTSAISRACEARWCARACVLYACAGGGVGGSWPGSQRVAAGNKKRSASSSPSRLPGGQAGRLAHSAAGRQTGQGRRPAARLALANARSPAFWSATRSLGSFLRGPGCLRRRSSSLCLLFSLVRIERCLQQPGSWLFSAASNGARGVGNNPSTSTPRGSGRLPSGNQPIPGWHAATASQASRQGAHQKNQGSGQAGVAGGPPACLQHSDIPAASRPAVTPPPSTTPSHPAGRQPHPPLNQHPLLVGDAGLLALEAVQVMLLGLPLLLQLPHLALQPSRFLQVGWEAGRGR